MRVRRYDIQSQEISNLKITPRKDSKYRKKKKKL